MTKRQQKEQTQMTQTPKPTQTTILQNTRNLLQLRSDHTFAVKLGVSRNSLALWKSGKSAPNVEWLQKIAVRHVGAWKGDLAIDLLKVRGLAIPCNCQTAIGDCGPCPKHLEQTRGGGRIISMP